MARLHHDIGRATSFVASGGPKRRWQNNCDRARAAGFFSRIFFVATADPSINAARVARRVMQGGHDVPIPKIIARHFRSIANCSLIAREVNRLYLYDNSVDGEPAKLVLRANKGVIEKQYCAVPEWMEPIADVLNQT